MSVAQRKDGRWVVKFKVDTPTGAIWKQRAFPRGGEAEARAFDAECAYDNTENTRMTLAEAVLAFVKGVPHVDDTSRCYEFLVAGHDRKDGTHREGPAEFLSDRYVDMLNRRDLEAFRDAYRAQGAGPATVRQGEGKLKAALNWCADQDLIESNPWAKYRGLPCSHKSRQGSFEDFQKVYAELPGWMQWACRTAMALCLRPGVAELFQLRWKAFDWKSGTVCVQMPKVGGAKTVYPPQDYLVEAAARWTADGRSGEALVCRNAAGMEVRKGTYITAWRVARKKAGVDIPMYAIRHIAASMMLAGGADLAAVAAQLGHRCMTTTGSFYAHALPQAQKAASKALPACTTFGADGAAQAGKTE